MKKKTKLGRNLEISSRITLSTIFGIIVPVIIIVIGSSIFFNKITSYFDFASVTTDSYSMLNQIQWNQTMASISNELISSDKNEVKYQKVDGFVKSLEKYGTKICIEQNNKPFYSTADKRDTLNTANSIIKINTDNNLNYFGENGMVIVTHIEGGKDKYLVIIANPDYKVEDVSTRNVMQDYSSLVFGKTGLLFALIILIFIISIIVISIIT